MRGVQGAGAADVRGGGRERERERERERGRRSVKRGMSSSVMLCC